MTLEIKVNDPHFQYQPWISHDVCLVQIWWFQPKFGTSYRMDMPDFLEFWGKMAKMTLKVKVRDLHFQYHLWVSHEACMVQIWCFQRAW